MEDLRQNSVLAESSMLMQAVMCHVPFSSRRLRYGRTLICALHLLCLAEVSLTVRYPQVAGEGQRMESTSVLH
jgi:hypothetical protein